MTLIQTSLRFAAISGLVAAAEFGVAGYYLLTSEGDVERALRGIDRAKKTVLPLAGVAVGVELAVLASIAARLRRIR